MMLKGRLGLESARIPQCDRHGLLWVGRGKLYVEKGTLHFNTVGGGELPPGNYALPFQMLSAILLEPGTTVSHDALRLLSRHGTGLVVVGEGGVRLYASLPASPDRSARARRQARLWADEAERIEVARRMYAWRLGEVFPAAELSVLRGMEGSRMRRTYQLVAERFGIRWTRRKYDRDAPMDADLPNQALNHAATAMYALATVAVAVTGAIPQLGFIHEESGMAFALDIADLLRDAVTLPIAFQAVRDHRSRPNETLERSVRKAASAVFRKEKVIVTMIDRIKELLDVNDGGRDPERDGSDAGLPDLVHV